MFPNKHIGAMGGGVKDLSSDITISTFKSLKNCALEKCQLLLVDELQSTVGEEISQTLCTMSPIRTFGYTATDEGMFSKSEKVVKGLFGERLIYIDYEQSKNENAVVPVTVYFVRTPTDIMLSASTVEGKIAQGIKRCTPRNKLIGQVCSLIPNKWQTIIFVDHIEDHLIPLHKELPLDTKYIHRNSNAKEVGSYAMTAKEQKKVIQQFKDNEFQYLLATDCLRAGFDSANCRVVIQGSGGSSEIEILQEAYRCSRILPEEARERLGVEPKTHAILIDFMDQHDSTLEGMSKKRMEIYRKQGWKIKEVDSPSQIDWFDH